MKINSLYLVFFWAFLFLHGCQTKDNQQIEDRKSPDFETFTGDSLRHIAFPVGGIGTGNVLLGGRANIKALEIFNKPEHITDRPPYMTFFALRMQNDDTSMIRVLEREYLPSYPNGFGIPRQQLPGLPRFPELTFNGQYPLANISFHDPQLPLDVKLEAFNPFIPLDVDNSSIPAAIFNWEVKNTGQEDVELALVFSVGNPLKNSKLGNGKGVKISKINRSAYRGLKMESPISDSAETTYGQLAILTTEKETDRQCHWFRGNWWDNAEVFLNDFATDGHLESLQDTAIDPGNTLPDVASLNIRCKLKAGETKRIPVYLCWYVPNRQNDQSYALGNEEATKIKFKNYYTHRFADVDAVNDYLINQVTKLTEQTKLYHKRLTNSSFPTYVIDAASSQSAALKTNLVMRTEDGGFHAFEGLGYDFGCCPGNCSHVWNYAQTMAALFPSLERRVREDFFKYATFDNGYQNFRIVYPLGDYWFQNVATDGQMGNIVRLYREWKYSGDSQWLEALWPKVKAALEFAWKGTGTDAKHDFTKNIQAWDTDNNGILDGRQHNTYDIDFFGPNMMTGSLYLAALKACSEMAAHLGDTEKEEEYKARYRSARKQYDELLWNGEYYIQKVQVAQGVEIPERLQSPPDENGRVYPKYQYANGCLSDQLLGQYLAHISGLGYILDSVHVDKAMKAVFDYNFKEQLRQVQTVQRCYALNDESGLLICTWPKGGRPLIPFVYSDEVWTGIEYQVAASLIYSGHIDQGLRLVEAVRDRYRGYNRNPYAEIESGYYYARAMANWSVLWALTGYQYDAIVQKIAFEPKINQTNFQTFWSAGSAWGNFRQTPDTVKLSVDFGSLKIKCLHLDKRLFAKAYKRIELNGQTIDAQMAAGKLTFSKPLLINEKQTLSIYF